MRRSPHRPYTCHPSRAASFTLRAVRLPALLLALLLLALLAACQLRRPWAQPTPPPPGPTASPAPRPSPSPTTAPTPSTEAVDLSLAAEGIVVYPGPGNYSGDQVTFDVTPQHLGAIDPNQVTVRIYHGAVAPGSVIAEGHVGYVTFDGVARARFVWAWDTSGLVGEQTLIAWLDPDDTIRSGDEDPRNNVVTFTLHLAPPGDLPPLEEQADWVTTSIACCRLHYLDDTAAGRDIAAIADVAQEAVDEVAGRLGVTQSSPLRLYLVGRVIGHGGYAYDAVALSYLDRHYAGFDLGVVMRHEATHVLDGLMLEVYPPAILREGLATYMGGGHYKPEPLPQRTAALLNLGLYVPLETLADDFYRQQHEVGYLEGAGFVSFLVDTAGWEQFRAFYASFPTSSDAAAAQLDAALARGYGQGLAEMEQAFRAWLRRHAPTADQVRDLRDTIDLFDALRRYQQLKDPRAYWMSAFLPNPTEGARRAIVADFLRHPLSPENIALEAMLIAARKELEGERYAGCEALVAAVNRVLDTDAWEGSLEADYLAIVRAVAADGYEAQQIALAGDTARVQAIAEWPRLERLFLRRTAGGWQVDK